MIESERFWKKVSVGSSSDCWEWQAGMSGLYGAFRKSSENGGKTTRAHRYALEQKLGRELLPEECACHYCDNTKCCNPDHLFVGSSADNIADMNQKNRQRGAAGSRHRSSKLTEEDVIIIRESSKTNTQLALEYGVKQHTISYVRSRKTWKHI